jgi:hypothetical protein
MTLTVVVLELTGLDRGREIFGFGEEADALRLAERLRRADPEGIVHVVPPENAALADAGLDATGRVILVESARLGRRRGRALAEQAGGRKLP